MANDQKYPLEKSGSEMVVLLQAVDLGVGVFVIARKHLKGATKQSLFYPMRR